MGESKLSVNIYGMLWWTFLYATGTNLNFTEVKKLGFQKTLKIIWVSMHAQCI